MDMAGSSERVSFDACTRASVEAYLRAVVEERSRIERAIAMAHRRRDEAIRIRRVLDAGGTEEAPLEDPLELTRAVAR
jgi:hypothetical protein